MESAALVNLPLFGVCMRRRSGHPRAGVVRGMVLGRGDDMAQHRKFQRRDDQSGRVELSVKGAGAEWKCAEQFSQSTHSRILAFFLAPSTISGTHCAFSHSSQLSQFTHSRESMNQTSGLCNNSRTSLQILHQFWSSVPYIRSPCWCDPGQRQKYRSQEVALRGPW